MKKRIRIRQVLQSLECLTQGSYQVGKGIAHGAWLAVLFLLRWLASALLLFGYSTRRLFTVANVVALVIGMAVGTFLTMYAGAADLAGALRILLPALLILSIVFSMSLLPRESDSGALEVFFSLPVRRYRLVIWHVLTVALWLLLLLLLFGGILRAVSPTVSIIPVVLQVYPALVCVSLLTVWLSTLTRNGPAAGLLSGVFCYLHLFKFGSFGPVRLFPSPWIPAPPSPWGVMQISMVVVICILLLVQINERLKKTELWFR